MNIRHLLIALVTLAASSISTALEVKPYTEANFAKAQADGKSTALHFHADWCPVCKKQTTSMESLKGEKNLDVTVFVANYDLEEPLKKKLGITGQSTFVVFKGAMEKGRMAGSTSPEAIKTVLMKAL